MLVYIGLGEAACMLLLGSSKVFAGLSRSTSSHPGADEKKKARVYTTRRPKSDGGAAVGGGAGDTGPAGRRGRPGPVPAGLPRPPLALLPRPLRPPPLLPSAAAASASALPFKTLALNLVSLLAPSLLRLSLAVDPPSSSWDDADLDSDADDLHLAAADFLSRCLPRLPPASAPSPSPTTGPSPAGAAPTPSPSSPFSVTTLLNWSIPLNSTIVAPNLVELEFTSVEPKILILETPSLSDLNLIIVKPSATIVGAEKCLSLRNLRIESFGIPGLARMFGGSQSLKRLEIEIPRRTRTDELYEALSLSDLLRNFPHLDELTVGPEAWFELQKPCNILTSTGYSRCLKKLTVHLEPSDFDIKFMALFLSLCGPLCEVTILFFDSSEAAAREQIVTKCASDFPMVRWKWGTRKKPNRNTL
uniref:FBD domain-containing protein n=1 Tax=Ananas comosus var. bracteatus TaxID=296719 RepID=A0A6V7QK18_ANACO|nr:unnamed protein product [Ananas comosus var. bracteatus]